MRGFGKSCLDTTARFVLAGLLNLNVNTIKRLAVLFLFLLGCLAPKDALANDVSYAVNKGYLDVSYAVKQGYLIKCWKFETEKNKFEQPGHPTLPYYSLCLRNKNQAVGLIIGSEGHGRDFEYKWYLIKGPYIILSPLGTKSITDQEEKCRVSRVKSDSFSKEGIILSECRFSGVWRRDDEAWELELLNDAGRRGNW